MPWKGDGTSPSPTGPIRTPVESRRRLSALLRGALAGAVLAVAATTVVWPERAWVDVRAHGR